MAQTCMGCRNTEINRKHDATNIFEEYWHEGAPAQGVCMSRFGPECSEILITCVITITISIQS